MENYNSETLSCDVKNLEIEIFLLSLNSETKSSLNWIKTHSHKHGKSNDNK